MGLLESNKRIKPKYFDPLGPWQVNNKGKAVFGATGAPEMRSSIFDYLTKNQPAMLDSARRTADAFRTAAANPGYAAASDLAGRTLRGDFLNGSPQLEALLAKTRAANTAEGANAAARVRGQYQSNGLPWSTANQQAQQMATAGATAKSDATEAATRLQDYQVERANQGQAVGALDQAISSPLSYMQAATGAEIAPLNDIAQLIAGLAGNGQLVKDDILQKRGSVDQATAAVGNL